MVLVSVLKLMPIFTSFLSSASKGTNAIYALEDGEKTPKTITWTENKPKGKLVLLQNGKTVKYTVKGNQVTVTLPSGLKNEPLAFKFNSK